MELEYHVRKVGDVPRELCALAVSLADKDLLGGAPCEILSAGNPTLFIPLKDASAVDRASVDGMALTVALQHCAVAPCVYVFSPTMVGAYLRMFAPHLGVYEDPATGSAAGPLVAYMMMHGLVIRADGSRFLIEQGPQHEAPYHAPRASSWSGRQAESKSVETSRMCNGAFARTSVT